MGFKAFVLLIIDGTNPHVLDGKMKFNGMNVLANFSETKNISTGSSYFLLNIWNTQMISSKFSGFCDDGILSCKRFSTENQTKWTY